MILAWLAIGFFGTGGGVAPGRPCLPSWATDPASTYHFGAFESASHPALWDSPGNYLYIGDTQNYSGVLEGGSYYAAFEAHPFGDLEESFTLSGFTGVGSISLATEKTISRASRLRPSEARQFQRLRSHY